MSLQTVEHQAQAITGLELPEMGAARIHVDDKKNISKNIIKSIQFL